MTVFGPPGRGDRIARKLWIPLLVALALLLAIFWVFFTPVRIEGDSMLPGLQDDDRVLATRDYTDPVRGDIVRIQHLGPDGQVDDRVIKRVVALAGDTVEIASGQAFVNGDSIDDSDDVILADDDVSVAEVVVPDGYVYVLGDNRPISLDSRFFGPVPLEAVAGRVVFRSTPVTRIGPVD